MPEFFFTSWIFLEIFSVLSSVSCIPAASSWVAAELSMAWSLLTFIISSSLVTLSTIVELALSSRSIMLLNTFLISCTELAMTPISSFCCLSFLPICVGVKSSLEVCCMISVTYFIGLEIIFPIKIPIPADTISASTSAPNISPTILFASANISAFGAVSTSFIPLSRLK